MDYLELNSEVIAHEGLGVGFLETVDADVVMLLARDHMPLGAGTALVDYVEGAA